MSDREQKLLDTFRSELKSLSAEIADLRAKLPTGNAINEYFLHRLIISHENATGCVHLAQAKLNFPLTVVSRTLFESLITTYWASLSDENTTAAVMAAEREIYRIMRKMIWEGHAEIGTGSRERIGMLQSWITL